MAGHIGSIVPQRGGVSPIDSNTVFYAPFDEDSKDILKGIKSIGNKVSLSCTNNGYVSIPHSAELDLINTVTLEAWLRYTTTGNVVVMEKSANNTHYQFQILELNQGGVGPGGRIAFMTNSSGFPGTSASLTPLSYADGMWHHFIGTYSRNETTSKLYVDGVLVSTNTTHTSGPTSNTLPFNIGSRNGASGFGGSVDSVRIWNRVLSNIEVVDAMKGNLKENLSGIVGHWMMNEGEGVVINDYSSVGNDGFLIGGAVWTEGRAIYSLVNGGGVLVEEGTNNLLKGKTGISVTNASVTKISEYEYVVSTTTDDISGINFLSTIANNGLAKTFSFYIKGVEGVKLIVQIHTSFKTIILAKEEQYVEFTVAENTTNTSLAIFTGYNDAPAVATTFELSKIQLEEKAFSTSFVDGVRGNAMLQYPNPIEEAQTFTVSAWVKVKNKSVTSGDTILTVENAVNVDNLVIDFDTNMTLLRSFTYGSNGTVNLATTNGVVATQWNHIAVTGDQSKITIYVNGIKKTEVAVTNQYKLIGSMSIGKRKSIPSYGNILMDELRIDKVTRTAGEIQAWYYQGRNGW